MPVLQCRFVPIGAVVICLTFLELVSKIKLKKKKNNNLKIMLPYTVNYARCVSVAGCFPSRLPSRPEPAGSCPGCFDFAPREWQPRPHLTPPQVQFLLASASCGRLERVVFKQKPPHTPSPTRLTPPPPLLPHNPTGARPLRRFKGAVLLFNLRLFLDRCLFFFPLPPSTHVSALPPLLFLSRSTPQPKHSLHQSVACIT